MPATISEILEDNLSGSVTLLKRLMTALENELMSEDLQPEVFISHIEEIRQKMEMFTVIRHFCDELILSQNISEKAYPDLYLGFIKEYKEFWEHTPQMLMSNLLNTIPLKNKTIMLHSNSGTIREVFRLLPVQDLNIRIYQTLSAPAEEGRIQAHDLAEMGYEVTLITDALAGLKMKDSDLLILGADQVKPHSIINKTGSLQMVLAAQEFDVPVVILTESRKSNYETGGGAFSDKRRSESEILNEIIHPNIKAENIYFEEVPKYMIKYLITEKRSSEE